MFRLIRRNLPLYEIMIFVGKSAALEKKIKKLSEDATSDPQLLDLLKEMKDLVDRILVISQHHYNLDELDDCAALVQSYNELEAREADFLSQNEAS